LATMSSLAVIVACAATPGIHKNPQLKRDCADFPVPVNRVDCS
jgi:hypothetical protein